MMKKKVVPALLITALAVYLPSAAHAESTGKAMFTPQQMADWLHLVMATDRAVYTKVIVNRLTKKDKVIKASEHFEDDQALALPAQMFRFGAEGVAEKTEDFSYSLMSLWPINKQNAPVTDLEKTGLQFIVDNPGENYYGEEELGGKNYFTAVYPDPAVAPVCVSCHNDHKDTPKTDFKLGDVMGGVVIRIPVGE